MNTLTLPFNSKTKHRVHVIFHKTTRALRAHLTRAGDTDSANTVGACGQHSSMGTGELEVIATLHFAMDNLRLSTVVHETIHACLHRARILGVDDPDWVEETICEEAGDLAEVLWREAGKRRHAWRANA